MVMPSTSISPNDDVAVIYSSCSISDLFKCDLPWKAVPITNENTSQRVLGVDLIVDESIKYQP